MIPKPTKLPEVGRDKHLANYLNRLADYVAQFEIREGRGYKVSKTSIGTVLTIAVQASGAASDNDPPVWQ